MKHKHVMLIIIVSSFVLAGRNLRYELFSRDDQWQQKGKDRHDELIVKLKLEGLFLQANSALDGSTNGLDTKARTKIAYAVTVTGFDPESTRSRYLFDRAAVLHYSVKLAMEKSHRYDYDIYAFVHPDAIVCASILTRLGYNVQVRETPFNISEVANKQLVDAQRIGCCGEKEYLKLYSYLLFDYPLVVHLDLDAIVLKPMDDVFDLMLDPTYNSSHFNNSTMWTDMDTYDGKVDFVFTRDYNMVRKE
jgi:alpha-N-acetylglucosamine transferase